MPREVFKIEDSGFTFILLFLPSFSSLFLTFFQTWAICGYRGFLFFCLLSAFFEAGGGGGGRSSTCWSKRSCNPVLQGCPVNPCMVAARPYNFPCR